ncbi:MAG: UDP-2,3-diacylglucosamine diphosphatase LpxI [Turneriella sp.]|nr:UDP-2,3-diacylglucosamine diphosphatase LpxI [Turneriella sp.]
MQPAKLAILAGAGELPLIAARNAHKQGWHFSVYAIAEATPDARLLAEAREKRSVSAFRLAETLDYLRADQITHLLLLGKLEKRLFLEQRQRDSVAEALYQKSPDRRDDTLFAQFAQEVEQLGITILPQREFLQDCFLKPGVPTRRQPTPAIWEDIEFGYAISKKLGSLDIGQTAVVFEKMVLAVEAIEGTDAAIRRAGELAHRRGGVVAKTAKASQDPRFDLPAVGRQTLDTMAEAGMQALVIEAAQTLVVEPADLIARADELDLIVVAR